MARFNSCLAALCAGIGLAGCSFATDVLWPTLTGEDPSKGSQQQVQTQQAQGLAPGASTLRQTPPPRLGTSQFQPQPVTPGAPTGTFVGQKVTQMRGELQRMQSEVSTHNGNLQKIRAATIEHSLGYHNTVATINARLQVGTTPGNPLLVSQWNVAQSGLESINADIAQMNGLANGVAGTASLSSFLLESTRAAYGLSGGVDEDHRQLAIFEDEVNKTVVLIDRLLNELSEDISRQSNYLSGERRNLTTLSLAIKNGEPYGSNLANRAYSTAAPFTSAAPVASARRPVGRAQRRPLVVIRFDRPNVAFEQALYTAVSRALERRPTAGFDVVAIAPNRGSPAQVTVASLTSKRNAEAVLRSLSDMGLPLDRVRLSATTSGGAQTNEVHIYVR